MSISHVWPTFFLDPVLATVCSKRTPKLSFAQKSAGLWRDPSVTKRFIYAKCQVETYTHIRIIRSHKQAPWQSHNHISWGTTKNAELHRIQDHFNILQHCNSSPSQAKMLGPGPSGLTGHEPGTVRTSYGAKPGIFLGTFGRSSEALLVHLNGLGLVKALKTRPHLSRQRGPKP